MQAGRWQRKAWAGEAMYLPTGRHASTMGEWLIRPASTADAQAVQAFVRKLSSETRRKRFFGPIVELSPEQLERVTSRAGACDLNLLVLDPSREIIGMAQCVATGDAEAEFALVVADNWQRRGIGTALCSALFRHAGECGLARLGGFVLTENRAMLGFAAKLGFSLVRDTDATLTRAVIALANRRLPAPECERAQTREHAGVAA